jgi:hypothetical protein
MLLLSWAFTFFFCGISPRRGITPHLHGCRLHLPVGSSRLLPLAAVFDHAGRFDSFVFTFF